MSRGSRAPSAPPERWCRAGLRLQGSRPAGPDHRRRDGGHRRAQRRRAPPARRPISPSRSPRSGSVQGLVGLARAGWGQRGIRGRDLVAFTQQLATLLEAGLPIDRALAIQEGLTTSPRLRTIADDVLRSVRGGTSLGEAAALARRPGSSGAVPWERNRAGATVRLTAEWA